MIVLDTHVWVRWVVEGDSALPAEVASVLSQILETLKRIEVHLATITDEELGDEFE